jgi:hypothetical protein
MQAESEPAQQGARKMNPERISEMILFSIAVLFVCNYFSDCSPLIRLETCGLEAKRVRLGA